MATFNQNIDEMKRALRNIVKSIHAELYSKLIVAMEIPVEVYQEFDTAELYFIEQLLNDSLRPWYAAMCLRNLEYIAIAEDFEHFAITYNFANEEQPQIELTSGENEIVIMQKLLTTLKQELTKSQLLAIRVTKNKTFETIFRDLLDSNYLTPSLQTLRHKLQEEDREDLAALVAEHAPAISSMDSIKFKRIVSLCLDSLDNDIVEILKNLRDILSKQYSSFHSLSEQTYSMNEDFIPLTFTKEVDTRTEPVTEGSDAELQTLLKHDAKRDKKQTSYIDAHNEIYSESMDGAVISLIGHPGSGKTFYCNKLVNDFINQQNQSYRFVLSIACRNKRWHALENKWIAYSGDLSDIIKDFLQIVVPTFPNSKELTSIIIKSDGNGLLLVIDSFDEFSKRSNFSATLLCSILKREILSKCTILITSRPGAWNQLLRGYSHEFTLTHSWQLLGFSPDQRNQYIRKFLSEDKAASCHKFISTKPEINILSLIPVNTNLITSLVNSASTHLSQINTLTDLYTSLVVYTLDKELRRIDPSTQGIRKLQKMPDDMLRVFNLLAEMCYNGLLSRTITFPADEINKEIFKNQYTVGLGLFHTLRVETIHKTMIDYLSCPHLTLQEFLSAWHLTHKSPKDIASIVQQIFTDDTWPAMKVCVRFLCGLLTKDHSIIISIITHNMHKPCTPLFNCKYLLFSNSLHNYTQLNEDNTATHLSILPYVLETNQPSIITSYFKLMCPANNTIPHFYLIDSITPVDTYSLTQYISLLPHNTAISVLSIDITLFNSIQLDMLADSINVSSINTLLVALSSITDYTTLWEYSMKQKPIHLEDMKYEIQQLHINSDSMPTLLNEFNHITTKNKYIDNIYVLQIKLDPINLPITISNSFIQTGNSHFLKLLSCIHKITTSLHPPEQIYYQFNNVSFIDKVIMNTLIDTISSTAIYVQLSTCYHTPQFITTLISSLHKLEYLDIANISFKPEINAQSFKKLEERNMKGLYLHGVLIQNDSMLYKYLQSQSSLQEISLDDTTYNTEATLQAIKHLTSLQYFYIRAANDDALNKLTSTKKSIKNFSTKNKSTTTEDPISAYLNILYTNRHTLSYADYRFYSNFIAEHYTAILPILSQCTNLQCINLSRCSLTPLYMPALATTINQLHALLYINMSYNGGITDEGIITLTNTLASHNTAIWIDLIGCRLSSAPAIIYLINKFPCLKDIELDANEFSDTSKQELKMFTKKRKINLYI